MALTSQTVVDIVAQTQTITFYESSSQVDKITYSNNQITFQNIAHYVLNKSDYQLWFQYFFSFYNLLPINFPNIIFKGKWPLCKFDITESNPGVKRIIYTQTSNGVDVLVINYNTNNSTASFTARAAPVTISMQEFFTTTNMLTQYTNQVTQN